MYHSLRHLIYRMASNANRECEYFLSIGDRIFLAFLAYSTHRNRNTIQAFAHLGFNTLLIVYAGLHIIDVRQSGTHSLSGNLGVAIFTSSSTAVNVAIAQLV